MSASLSPRISVVLPVRNGAPTLARAIASLRAQSCAAWEGLVVDDGSTDGTADLLASLARAEPRLRLVRPDGAGLVAALQAGCAAARGDLIARLDADDEAHPDRLQAQADFLGAPENRAVGVAGCLVEFGGDRVARAGYALHVDWINGLTTPAEIALNRFVESPLAHPSVMFRRQLLAVHGGYRAGDFPEDYELWLRWLDAGVVMAKVPRVLLRWNDPPGRLSRTDARYAPEAFFRLKAGWIGRELARRGQPAVWIWGAGRPTRRRAAELERHGVRLEGYVDVDAKKATRAIGGTGRPVLTPAELPAPGRIFLLGYVSSRGARDLIREELQRRAYMEGRDFLMCA